mmetsp:Transcript_120656/g.235008  ORF Transcript_120656/g.235008 Transcript_120656/m.235008 type:complete len:388 (+) Transcript_120656:36-1199(+)
MKCELQGAIPATNHFAEAVVTVVPRDWAREATANGPSTPQLLNEQHLAAVRGRGVAVLALGCFIAEARKKRRRQRRSAGMVVHSVMTSAEVSAPQTYYELLGVPPSAGKSEIKHAYHLKMKACHPDICGEQGVDMAKLLNEAYALLQVPETRSAYDLTLPSQNESHSQVEAEDDEYDLNPFWQFKPMTKEDRGMVAPTWKNRPRSRSNYNKVAEEDRGENWEDQKFVYVNPFNCIACRNCLDVSPKTFGWDNFTGRAKVFNQWGESEEYISCSVQSCPVDCIHWVGREELQALEYVTARAVYDDGGQLPCPMSNRNGFHAGGTLLDPFEMAKDFMRKLNNDRQRAREKIKKATGQVSRVRLRIQEVFRKLPPAVRQLAWPRWRALNA